MLTRRSCKRAIRPNTILFQVKPTLKRRSHFALNDPDLYYSWGQAKMNLREYRQSVELFMIALKKGYYVSDCYERIGTDQSWLGDTTAAMNSFEKAIELEPKFKKAYQSRIDLLLNAKNAEHLVRNGLDKLLSLVTDSIEISHKYSLRSFYDLKLKDTVQAVTDIDRAVYAAPRKAYPYAMRAWIYGQINYKK